jgi:rhodanese-related sulfurtransferase
MAQPPLVVLLLAAVALAVRSGEGCLAFLLPAAGGGGGAGFRGRMAAPLWAVQDVTPKEAFDMLAREKDACYIDVRTEGEFDDGHVPASVNVPAFRPGAMGMTPVPTFSSDVQATVQPGTKIIIGCQAGSRSAAAAKLLDDQGLPYQIFNVIGGYGAWARDESLPVERSS